MSDKVPSRNPKGVVTDRPIALRLMPKELTNATRIAEQHGLSCAKLARQAFLAGLPIVESKLRES